LGSVVDILLFILGTLASLAIAVYEHRRATRAESTLKEVLDNLPRKLIEGVASVVNTRVARNGEPNSNLSARYADLNGDGRDEFLVEYVSGPHSTTLQVYGFKRGGYEFRKLGELSQSTPLGFELEDIDNDGAVEVTAVEVANEPELPFVFGLRDRVTYKLGGRGFREVRRIKCYSPEDVELAKKEAAGDDYRRDA
jgi:hypothetical protein